MNFHLSTNDNFASLVDKSTGTSIFVDSFDNKEFEVRIGTIIESKAVGKIAATSDQKLNSKLAKLYKIHIKEK